MPITTTAIGTMDFLTWGSGEDCLLILHASATVPGAYVDIAAQLDRRSRRILAPAFGGSGATQFNDAAPIDNTARNRALINEVLDETPSARRFLFGHSMGGLIALLVAIDRAQRGTPVDALILYEPILHDFLDPQSPLDAKALNWDRAIIDRLADDVHKCQPERGVRRFLEAWNEIPWFDLPERVRRQLVANADHLVRETRAMAGQGLNAKAVKSLNTPTILMRGDNSPHFTQLVTSHIANAIPGAKEITLAGCGHMAPLNAPARVAAAIDTFLTEL